MPVNAPNDNLDVLAPSFNLKNVDDQMVSLDNAKGLNGTVIVFICNHCPYVKAIASRLKKDADELLDHSINTIAIMSNDVINYPQDSPDKMKELFNDLALSIPYLYDESQEVAKSFKAECTPEFYLFDKSKRLVYRGRLDSSSPGNGEEITGEDFRTALDLCIDGKEINSTQYPSMGCNIKWK